MCAEHQCIPTPQLQAPGQLQSSVKNLLSDHNLSHWGNEMECPSKVVCPQSSSWAQWQQAKETSLALIKWGTELPLWCDLNEGMCFPVVPTQTTKAPDSSPHYEWKVKDHRKPLLRYNALWVSVILLLRVTIRPKAAEDWKKVKGIPILKEFYDSGNPYTVKGYGMLERAHLWEVSDSLAA